MSHNTTAARRGAMLAKQAMALPKTEFNTTGPAIKPSILALMAGR